MYDNEPKGDCLVSKSGSTRSFPISLNPVSICLAIKGGNWLLCRLVSLKARVIPWWQCSSVPNPKPE